MVDAFNREKSHSLLLGFGGGILVTLGTMFIISRTSILEFNISIPLVSSLFSLILSGLLVALYYRQTNIQSNQERLMRYEHKADIHVGIDLMAEIPIIVVQNTGRSAVKELTFDWSFCGEQHRIVTPIFSENERFERYLQTSKSEDHATRTKLHRKEMIMNQTMDNCGRKLQYDISYIDSFGEMHEESGEIDVVETLEKIGSRESVERAGNARTNEHLSSIEARLGDISQNLQEDDNQFEVIETQLNLIRQNMPSNNKKLDGIREQLKAIRREMKND